MIKVSEKIIMKTPFYAKMRSRAKSNF